MGVMEEYEGITPEQLATTLENMTIAWSKIPENQRLYKDEEKSLFEDPRDTIKEMIQRWHSGESSHPDREQLASMYPPDEDGAKKLQKHMMQIKDDPFVQAADLNLRLIKYTVER